MAKIATHPRISFFPYAKSFQVAHLDDLREETRGRSHDLILEYKEFSANTSSKMIMRDDKLYEKVKGIINSRRLRFIGVRELQISGAYNNPEKAPSNHPARDIRDLLHWIPAGRAFPFYLLLNSSEQQDGLRFFTRKVVTEKIDGRPIPFSIDRDWSSPPPMRTGLVPQPKKLHDRFGGDPITVRINSKPYHRRLFIGGLDIQPDQRPDVSYVLNLGEEPSKWIIQEKIPISDRWVNKGEDINGMSLEEIRSEAEWIIERLRAGERVLVHCVAGMNRSSTICCAVLILLESLTAEQALERVRKHHLWARPDSHHWLKLKWLAENR